MIKIFYNQLKNENVFSTLMQNNMPHAVLLLGDSHKCSIFARFMIAKILDKNPLEYAKNPYIHTDVSELPENLGTISIDDIREFKQTAQKKAVFSQKICLIESMQKMTRQAQNAILKLIEDPPGDTYFIFTAPNVIELLNTIVSRVTKIYLKPISRGDCAQILPQLITECSQQQANHLSNLFDGNLEWCVKFAELGTTNKMLTIVEKLGTYIEKNKLYKLSLELCKISDRENLILFLNCLKFILWQKLRNENKKIEPHKFFLALTVINKTLEKLNQNTNVNLTTGWLLASLYA
ncbi:MAG: hypothetical protein LBJ83_00055 [Oscillospiraceae bacterium]|jgi:DNA polymerase-3 subunit delta'|nr:hypothetical protein [Oscillospiraceae bacterium]